jgi:hypothetical protein
MIIYENRQDHLTSREMGDEMFRVMMEGAILSDAAAQTIASWWHSPKSPESTLLSTMGAVSDTMHISHFAGQHEYDMADERSKIELWALKEYIEFRQREAR